MGQGFFFGSKRQKYRDDWEKFANSNRKYQSKIWAGKPQPVKHICVSCMKAEVHAQAHPKMCNVCRVTKGFPLAGTKPVYKHSSRQEHNAPKRKRMSDVTVIQLREKVDKWYEKRLESDQAEEIAKQKNKELEALGFELVQMMEVLGIEKFGGALGNIRIHTDEAVSMPADEDKRNAFVQYLKDNGEWDSFATIHHHKLQAWYKAKQEEHGEFFMAPGLDLPKTRKSIRKTK